MKIGSSLLTEGEALRGAPKLFDFAILSLYYECLRSISFPSSTFLRD